jgi:hypothetical protein
MDKPTSLPWRLTDDHKVRRVVKGGTPERSIIIVEDWTREADAELIVRAVNSHEALRASLQELHDYLRTHGSVADTLEMLYRSSSALLRAEPRTQPTTS